MVTLCSCDAGMEPHSALPVAMPMVFSDHCEQLPKGLRGIKILAHTAVSHTCLTARQHCSLRKKTVWHAVLSSLCLMLEIGTTSALSFKLHLHHTDFNFVFDTWAGHSSRHTSRPHCESMDVGITVHSYCSHHFAFTLASITTCISHCRHSCD